MSLWNQHLSRENIYGEDDLRSVRFGYTEFKRMTYLRILELSDSLYDENVECQYYERRVSDDVKSSDGSIIQGEASIKGFCRFSILLE